MPISHLRGYARSEKNIETRIGIAQSHQEDVRYCEFEGKRRMEGDVDKHPFRAGMRDQEPSEFLYAARNTWTMRGRRCGVNKHRRFRNRLFGSKAACGRFPIRKTVYGE